MYDSLSMPVHLELLVQDENICLKTWYQISEYDYELPYRNDAAKAGSIERSLYIDNSCEYMSVPADVSGVYHTKIPAGRFGGGEKQAGESFLPNIPADIRDQYATKLAGTYWRCNSFAWIDPTDPSILGGEQSDAACWTIGIGYRQVGTTWVNAGHDSRNKPDGSALDGGNSAGDPDDNYKDTIMNCAFPSQNAFALSANTKGHPLRESRRLGAPASLFVYQPFTDTNFTDCSLSFKYNKGYGFSTNTTGWTVGDGYNYLTDMDSALPSMTVTSGGGSIDADGYGTVEFKMVDSDGATIDHATDIYLECTGGYLPKNRVSITGGTGSFKVGALGMESGDEFKVKIGFRMYTGLADVVFTVA
tara:strand:+ start:3887 stop:4969 length:1083 start_codon:yes stop_codon:yes gene_type:complete